MAASTARAMRLSAQNCQGPPPSCVDADARFGLPGRPFSLSILKKKLYMQGAVFGPPRQQTSYLHTPLGCTCRCGVWAPSSKHPTLGCTLLHLYQSAFATVKWFFVTYVINCTDRPKNTAYSDLRKRWTVISPEPYRLFTLPNALQQV